MRITRLSLAAYGHFTELALDFPTPSGLHVVLGANEAGKSTALAAIEDALFGFPHRSEAAWRHSPRDLRVGLTLHRDDGGERTFWRRKGREPTLLDENGLPVSEAALAGFLGRVTRERFRRVFGLNDTGLRQGGKAILEGNGDLGESVLEAETGLAGSREALQSLERAASALFGDRRGARAIWASLDRHDAARREMAERSVRGPDHARAEASMAELRATEETARLEAASLAAERTRLGRIRATTPARVALRGLHKAREALGAVTRLPGDAGEQREAAVLARAQAVRDLDRMGAERRSLAEALGSLRVDVPVLAEASAIELVAADLSRIEASAAEMARFGASAAANRAACVAAARGLGLDAAPDRIGIPASPLRHRARALLVSEPPLREAARAAAAALAARRQTLDALPADRAPDGSALALLEGVVDAVRALGPLEDELAQAERALADDEAALAASSLPHWKGGSDELVRLALPLEADEEEAATRLERANEALDASRRTLGEREREAMRAAGDLRATVAHGAPPSREALAERREERDRAFEALLASDGDVRQTLAEAYRRQVWETDAVADRRADQAVRVEEIERLRIAVDRTALAVEEARRESLQAGAEYAEAEAAWRAVWMSLPEPGSPAAMRVWRRRHAEILAASGALADARRGVEARRDRIEACHRRLDGVLPVDRSTLASRLDRAAALLIQARATASLLVERQGATEVAQRERAREEGELAAAHGRLAAWRSEWATIASCLGLPVDGAGVASETLSLWDAFETARAAWEEDERALALRGDAARDYDALLARLKASVPGASAIEGRVPAVAVLRAALRAAEDARDEMRRLKTALAELDSRIAASSRARDEADDTLAGLFAVARVADEPALQRAIERSEERARLDGTAVERERELRAIDDGFGLEALEAEAASVALPADALPARLAAIDASLATLEEEGKERARQQTMLAAELRAMSERTTASASVAIQDEIASMAEDGARYLRLRLAHVLLGASIEKLRRENQDPLLAHAGALFRTLTRGRYVGLEADDQDGRPVMLARRDDGSTCPVARLSEGTLDQLYLALRLASLEKHGAGAERIPLIADDLLASFDDDRARAALGVLRGFGAGNQTILFTHHRHIAAMAAEAGASLHHLEAA